MQESTVSKLEDEDYSWSLLGTHQSTDMHINIMLFIKPFQSYCPDTTLPSPSPDSGPGLAGELLEMYQGPIQQSQEEVDRVQRGRHEIIIGNAAAVVELLPRLIT